MPNKSKNICGYCGHERWEHFEGYSQCRGGACIDDCAEFEETNKMDTLKQRLISEAGVGEDVGQVLQNFALELQQPSLSHLVTDDEMVSFAKGLTEYRDLQSFSPVDCITFTTEEYLLPLYSEEDDAFVKETVERILCLVKPNWRT